MDGSIDHSNHLFGSAGVCRVEASQAYLVVLSLAINFNFNLAELD